VTKAIAGLEMQRQAMEKEAGLAASCSSARRKLIFYDGLSEAADE